MSWLDPLLDKIRNLSNPQAVAEEVIKYMAPIARDIEPGTDEEWWKHQIGAAMQLSAVKRKTSTIKGASK